MPCNTFRPEAENNAGQAIARRSVSWWQLPTSKKFSTSSFAFMVKVPALPRFAFVYRIHRTTPKLWMTWGFFFSACKFQASSLIFSICSAVPQA